MVNQDGSPVLAELSTQVVMYWHISENDTRTANSFQLSYYWLEKISQDYLAHDAAYEQFVAADVYLINLKLLVIGG